MVSTHFNKLLNFLGILKSYDLKKITGFQYQILAEKFKFRFCKNLSNRFLE